VWPEARGGGAGKVGEGKVTKREGESCWKRGGGPSASLYLVKGPRWQMRSGPTIPEAAGGEGGHGVAKPDGVIRFTKCQLSSGVREILVLAKLWYQQSSGIREILILEKFCVLAVLQVVVTTVVGSDGTLPFSNCS
jgi:hypothetical protein